MSDGPSETSNFSVGKRILGVLGGQDVDDRVFKFWAMESDILLAADAGADLALRHGIVPHAIIGDLDSVSEAALASGADIYKFDDENSTDCDKLLQWVVIQGHRSIRLIGVEGDRLDHVLGTLGSCARSPLDIRLILRDGEGILLKAGHHRLEAVAGQRVSLLPVGEVEGVDAPGLRWPLTQATLQLDGLVSVSNVVETAPLEISIASGTLLVILESTQPSTMDILQP